MLSLFFKLRWHYIVLVFLLMTWCVFLFAHTIDLNSADIGRHLKNGELLIQNFFPDSPQYSTLLRTNFYSYTYPEYPFLNHHWGSGIIFFIIFSLTNFWGLSLFYIIGVIAAMALIFRSAEHETGFYPALLFTVLALPLFAERKEVRPEIFSYIFSALFLWILVRWRSQPNTKRSVGQIIRNGVRNRLFLLPILMVFWVNLHIYFFIGFLVVGSFLLEELLRYHWNRVKECALIFMGTIVASLANPFGWHTLFYIRTLNQNYGYRIIENQSIFFLEKLGFIVNPNFLLFKVIFGIILLLLGAALIFNWRQFPVAYGILYAVLGTMGLFAIRNFSIYALFAIPTGAYALTTALSTKINLKTPSTQKILLALTGLAFFFTLILQYQKLSDTWPRFSIGAAAGTQNGIHFFKKYHMTGPIFNNYDIGSALIYGLYPQERVFVDNRPEAYPASFFEQTYIPMQENEDVWKKQNEQYGFNAIFFYHRDATPWAQKFLIARVQDPAWAPVYTDDFSIIFLKRNEKNKKIIEQYEIPKDRFRVQ